MNVTPGRFGDAHSAPSVPYSAGAVPSHSNVPTEQKGTFTPPGLHDYSVPANTGFAPQPPSGGGGSSTSLLSSSLSTASGVSVPQGFKAGMFADGAAASSTKKRMGDFVPEACRDMANLFQNKCDNCIIFDFNGCIVADVLAQFEPATIVLHVPEDQLANEMASQFGFEAFHYFSANLASLPFKFPFAGRADTPGGFVSLRVRISTDKLNEFFKTATGFRVGVQCNVVIQPTAYTPFKNITTAGLSLKLARVKKIYG